MGVSGAREGDGTCLPPQEDETVAAPADVAGRAEPTRRGFTAYSTQAASASAPNTYGHAGRARGEGPGPRAAHARPSGPAGAPLSGGGAVRVPFPRALQLGRSEQVTAPGPGAVWYWWPGVFVQSCQGLPHAKGAGKLGRGRCSGVRFPPPCPIAGRARGGGWESLFSNFARRALGRATCRIWCTRGPRAPPPRPGRSLRETLWSPRRGCRGRPRGLLTLWRVFWASPSPGGSLRGAVFGGERVREGESFCLSGEGATAQTEAQVEGRGLGELRSEHLLRVNGGEAATAARVCEQRSGGAPASKGSRASPPAPAAGGGRLVSRASPTKEDVPCPPFLRNGSKHLTSPQKSS